MSERDLRRANTDRLLAVQYPPEDAGIVHGGRMLPGRFMPCKDCPMKPRVGIGQHQRATCGSADDSACADFDWDGECAVERRMVEDERAELVALVASTGARVHGQTMAMIEATIHAHISYLRNVRWEMMTDSIQVRRDGLGREEAVITAGSRRTRNHWTDMLKKLGIGPEGERDAKARHDAIVGAWAEAMREAREGRERADVVDAEFEAAEEPPVEEGEDGPADG